MCEQHVFNGTLALTHSVLFLALSRSDMHVQRFFAACRTGLIALYYAVLAVDAQRQHACSRSLLCFCGLRKSSRPCSYLIPVRTSHEKYVHYNKGLIR